MSYQNRMLCCGQIYVSRVSATINTCPYCKTESPNIEEVDKEDHIVRVPTNHSGDKKFDRRPWGSYKVLLDEPNVKVKKIIVSPKQRLSLQLHKQREELWKVTSGNGVMTLGCEEFEIREGDRIEISKYEVHRVENNSESNLEFIEVQTGVCQEDDIVRIEDDYNRLDSQ